MEAAPEGADEEAIQAFSEVRCSLVSWFAPNPGGFTSSNRRRKCPSDCDACVD
jgi:hypothetical protein